MKDNQHSRPHKSVKYEKKTICKEIKENKPQTSQNLYILTTWTVNILLNHRKHIHFQSPEQGTDEDASVCHSAESTFDPNPAAKQAHQDTWPAVSQLVI